MIKVKGNKVTFTENHALNFMAIAKDLGLTPQDLLTGLLWENIMRLAREGVFKRGKKS